jgi:eukaryotic-like serine/threonine-protein kinase
LLGRTVSHYEVTASLGAGAMGEVYAARDILLGRSVAIKVLQGARGASEETRRRFLQEARAASALNHPGIVTIHDVVSDGDVDCIVMELVSGETLGDRMDRGPLPVEEALEIIDRIADALAAAHARGIVHRDLKPANVMLTKAGGLKVLDFGLAKFLSTFDLDTHAPPPLRTQSGIVVGTPLYMSPEQVMGKPLDGRSDIFSLGSMALQMLIGSNPFEADSAVATMHRIAYEPLEEAHLEGVPEVARGLIRRMLANNKEERFQTAEEVRQAIAEVRAGRPVAPAVTATLPAAPPAPKPRRLAFAFAALLVITIGLAAAQLWRTEAEPPASRESSPRSFAAPRTPHHHVQRGNELLSTYWRKGYFIRAAEEFQRAIALEPDHAGAHAGLASAYLYRHLYNGDRAWLDLALKNARHAVELDPQLASAHVALGAAELADGKVAVARKELEQTLRTDPANARAHRWLGAAAMREEDPKTAETELRKALALQPKDPDLYNALGWFLYTAARYEEAAGAFRQVIRLAPDYVAAYRNLGAVLHMRGDYAGAARAVQQSLESEPDATGYSNLGTLYFFQGLYPQAVSAFEKAVQLGANDHVVWGNLGDAYRWTPGNQTKARDAFATALHLLEDDARRQPGDATLQSRKALYLAKKGDARNALLTATPLMSGREKDPQTLYRLALAFELTGARDRSLTALSQAIRNGYSTEELKADPELASLRRDAQYQRMMTTAR